ncbi:MAG: nucleoside hydrolase [Prevotellaceae bacterium]|nr:nucleoside hydrolase [Prevotellaceae bacterium]
MKKILLTIAALFALSFAANAQMTKVKVLIDNDFCGDPDGLYELAQHALSPTTEIVGIVGGHLSENAGFTNRKDQATESVEKANALLDVMGLKGKYKVVAGAETGMTSSDKPIDSEGARLIISEAKKCSPEKPLYVTCGAALTNVASALLIDPSISKNIVIVWIGGQEYSFGAVPPPGYSAVEYNLNLSIPAGQVVFNKSDVMIWQIPRDVYRQCLYSTAEMHAYIKPYGKLGALLSDAIDNVMKTCEGFNIAMGEVYILGDSPLVLLTSLQSGFEADPCSSKWVQTPCPLIDNNGAYQPNPTGRIIRVYTQIDTRLMFRDLEARLQLASGK